MPALTRIGDLSVGEDGYPPRPAMSGTKTILANFKNVVIVGSLWAIHCKGNSCHNATSTSGAPGVFFENKAVVRVGDKLSDGDKVAKGSDNITVGDFVASSGGVTSGRRWNEMVMKWMDARFSWRNS